MKTLKRLSVYSILSYLVLSCTHNDIGKAKTEQPLVAGEWNSYEMKSSTTVIPGIGSNLTLMYESGLVFTADGKFGPRYYNAGIWTESLSGTYKFTNDQTLVLVFNPGTKDELSLPLKILKLDADHFWFQHSFWVNEQNPYPVEAHLVRVK